MHDLFANCKSYCRYPHEYVQLFTMFTETDYCKKKKEKSRSKIIQSRRKVNKINLKSLQPS